MKFQNSKSLLDKALEIIPEQTMTFAKAAHNFPVEAPSYVESAKGCEITDVDGNTFIDYTMGLGTAVLGYSDPEVTRAVIDQTAKGTLYSLPSHLEVTLSEKLIEIIPSAEKVRLYKNGADVCTLAVRLSRSYTKKDHVLFSGYHGHHEWYSHVLRDSGNLENSKTFSHKINYNDYDGIVEKVEALDENVACIILEMAFDKPENNFLEKIKLFCDEKNIILIFDEMWTGFRFPSYSFQEYIGVTPHLSIFSKGIANGYTISAIVGRKDIMDEFNNVWGFTTFGGDALSISAAIKNIERIKETNAIEYIWSKGLLFQKEINQLLIKYNLNDKIFVSGYPCRFKLDFKQDFDSKNAIDIIKKTFLENGILWNNMFVFSLAHKDIHLQKTLSVFNNALSKI